jgi:hypothetical protein
MKLKLLPNYSAEIWGSPSSYNSGSIWTTSFPIGAAGCLGRHRTRIAKGRPAP